MSVTATIKLTKRMLDKSIIDANKSVLAFVDEYLSVTYDDIPKGADHVLMNRKHLVPAVFEDDTHSEIRLYRRPRGDRLLSIKGLSKVAEVGDTITFNHEAGVTTVSVRDSNNVVTLQPRNHFVRILVEKAA